MIYVLGWEDWGIKLGYAKDPLQRAFDGWWTNQHPPELCGRLTLEHCRLLGVWAGSREDEDTLQKEFNGGTRHRDGKHHDEFYPWAEWPKNLRDLETNYTRLPEPTLMPTHIKNLKRKRCEGCGGGAYYCTFCKCTVGDWPRHKATQKHLVNSGSAPLT